MATRGPCTPNFSGEEAGAPSPANSLGLRWKRRKISCSPRQQVSRSRSAVPALRLARERSGVRSCAAQLIVAIEAMAPSAASAGSTAVNGSGARRVSTSASGGRGRGASRFLSALSVGGLAAPVGFKKRLRILTVALLPDLRLPDERRTLFL